MEEQINMVFKWMIIMTMMMMMMIMMKMINMKWITKNDSIEKYLYIYI